VVHVERRDVVSELAQDVPEARRVRSAGDEAGHGPAGLDQVVPADEGLHALPNVHKNRVRVFARAARLGSASLQAM
jgi:hypothetical protein